MSNEQPETMERARILSEALDSSEKPKIGEGQYDYAKRADLPRMLREQAKDALFFECDPHVTGDAWNIVQMAADELEAALATPSPSTDTLEGGRKSYNAKVREDMRALAIDLSSVPVAAHPAVAARLMAERIMLPKQWWLRVGIWVVKKRRHIGDYEAWAALCVRAPELAADVIGQTCDWIVSGKDADGEGVGGLNQREVNAVATMLATLNTGGSHD